MSSHGGEARHRAGDQPPLLVVYAIDQVSTPVKKEGNREALNVETSPISMALFLPKSETFVDYVRPTVGDVDQTEVEPEND